MSAFSQVGESELRKISRFLDDYGYFPDDALTVEAGIPSEVALTAAVRKYQSMVGLPETGEPDPITISMMGKPRCGVSDFARMRRTGQLNAWSKSIAGVLKWYRDEGPMGYLPSLSHDDQDEVIQEAFDIWASHTELLKCERTFNQSEANFIFSTSNSRREEFGSPGGVLAWMYLPSGPNHTGALLCKADRSEPFVLEPSLQGVDFPATMRHEIGHGLGLDHTNVAKQLMNPYLSAIRLPQSAYDIAQIVQRYGKASSRPSPAPTPTQPTAGKLDVDIKVRINGVVYGAENLAVVSG